MEWRASHILVKDPALANDLLMRIRKGARFDEVARAHSTCPSKNRGGDLGWFGPGQMAPAFEKAVKRLGNGGLSGLVRTKFGIHIIRKTGQRE